MGTFSYPIEIADLAGAQSREIEAIVDTGAFFTTLPSQLLRDLGIQPNGTRRFRVADGRLVDMKIGDARVTIDGDSVFTIVAFGEDSGPSLLGAYTLEGLTLLVDPVEQRLIPNSLLML